MGARDEGETETQIRKVKYSLWEARDKCTDGTLQHSVKGLNERR